MELMRAYLSISERSATGGRNFSSYHDTSVVLYSIDAFYMSTLLLFSSLGSLPKRITQANYGFVSVSLNAPCTFFVADTNRPGVLLKNECKLSVV